MLFDRRSNPVRESRATSARQRGSNKLSRVVKATRSCCESQRGSGALACCI